MALQKSIGTGTLLASAIAGIVGSGWLLGPMACAKIAGPAAIISWIIGGILMMIVATTFVLLTRARPITGGTVRFFQITYGHFAGFGFSWLAWLAWVAVPPIETMALIQYSANYIPSLMTNGTSPILTPTGVGAAIACLLLIALINNFGMRVYSKLNHFILAFKLLIPVITAGLLLSAHFQTHNLVSAGGFMPYGFKGIFAALPLAGVVYSFIGFNPVIQCAGEAKNPRRAIPIAIFGALIICIILYTLLQLAFITALPQSTIAHGWAAISFAGDKGPFAGLLSLFGFVWFIRVLYVGACVSPFGTAMVQSMATSRLTYAMSENGYFSKYFLKTNKHGTPMRALLLNTIIGLAFFLPFPSWQHMVGFLVSCLVLGFVIGPMSLMILAHRDPADFRPFSQKTIHVICIAAFYICNLMIYWSGWPVISKIMILFAFGYLLLGFQMARGKGPCANWRELNIMKSSWVIFYLIGLTIISKLGSFGGEQIIPFGKDFIVIALFSASIYAFAFIINTKKEKRNVQPKKEFA